MRGYQCLGCCHAGYITRASVGYDGLLIALVTSSMAGLAYSPPLVTG